MNSSRTIIVVAPGCPSELIQELLSGRILPTYRDLIVLLPSGNTRQYNQLLDKQGFNGNIQFLPSPAQRFFSTRHLKWLKENLRSSENIMVLISNSPYRDLTSAMVSLLSMILSHKTIILLRKVHEPDPLHRGSVIDLSSQSFTDNWLFIEFNLKVLAKEFGKIAWSSYPEFIKNFINNKERDLCYYFEAHSVTPVNFQPLDSSTEALQRDVEHSVLLSNSYLNKLPEGVQSIKGKRVLEIGPGTNLGPILTLACHGAEVLVADRFLTPWDPDYHPQFYALLRDKLKNRWPSINLTPLDRILSQGGYPPESISLYPCSLEELSEVPDQSVDVVISNAVLEHLYDLKSAFFYLARITKLGGLGIHNVDFRDHRNFSRPLEYLLLSNKEFSREFKERQGECGNRYRPQEIKQLLELVGFEIKDLQPISFVEEDYFNEFLGRLRQARKSRYRDYPPEDLRLISGSFIVIKKQTRTPAKITRAMAFLPRVAGFLGRRYGALFQ